MRYRDAAGTGSAARAHSGALKPVLPGWTPKALSVYGIYLSRDYQPSALPLFLDEIQQQLAQLS